MDQCHQTTYTLSSAWADWDETDFKTAFHGFFNIPAALHLASRASSLCGYSETFYDAMNTDSGFLYIAKVSLHPHVKPSMDWASLAVLGQSL